VGPIIHGWGTAVKEKAVAGEAGRRFPDPFQEA